MANNSLAKLMQREYRKGMEHGFDAFAMVALIAGYNVSDEVFVNDDQYIKFFKLWEDECVRIFAEECHNDPEAATDILRARTDELREKYGMEVMNDRT